MALVVKDRVKVTSTTTGTGTFTLGSAALGFQDFSVIGNGNTTYYTIAGVGTSEFEVGIGTYTASGTTLSRDTILESSNSGSAVNFSAGSKEVFVTYPAERSIYTDGAGSAITPATASRLGFANLAQGSALSVLGVTGNATADNASIAAAADHEVLRRSGTTVGFGAVNLGQAAAITGTLPVGNGGTGTNTLTANNVLLGNGGSAVTFVAPGSNGNLLTSNGTTWTSAAPGGGFDAGTVMLFAQTAAPTGWTKNTTTGNNHALRIVTGTASSGGSVDFSTAFASQTPSGSVSVTISSITGSAGSTTLSTPQIPSHAHGLKTFAPGTPNQPLLQNNFPVTGGFPATSASTGGGGSHDHPFSFSSGSASGSFSGNAINLAVRYIDVIRASKD